MRGSKFKDVVSSAIAELGDQFDGLCLGKNNIPSSPGTQLISHRLHELLGPFGNQGRGQRVLEPQRSRSVGRQMSHFAWPAIMVLLLPGPQREDEPLPKGVEAQLMHGRDQCLHTLVWDECDSVGKQNR
jgi:hypothetical protein